MLAGDPGLSELEAGASTARNHHLTKIGKHNGQNRTSWRGASA